MTYGDSNTFPIADAINRPVVAVALTVLVFVGSQRLQRRWPFNPLCNPTFLSIVAIAGVIEASGVSHAQYVGNTQVISFMLAPTVALLAVPLYRRLPLVAASWRVIASGLVVGLPTGVLSTVAIAMACGARHDTLLSLAPKNVTAGIAAGISESIGGIPALTTVFTIMTGIFGAAFGPVLLRGIGVRDHRAIGMAMGISSHGIGTARAFQISETAGAFSSLGMALNGVTTAIILAIALAITGPPTRGGHDAPPLGQPAIDHQSTVAKAIGVSVPRP